MKILNVKVEDFTNYKKPSMFVGMGTCTFKCCKEAGISPEICQNYILQYDSLELEPKTLVGYYMSNTITEALVIGGLEPFDTFIDLLALVDEFRRQTYDDIVIYTGYYPYEITTYLEYLTKYDNIIIKFGRFIPDCKKKKDKLLGVDLASSNQYAVRLNKDVNDIIKALKDNDGYCPCMIKKKEDTKCCCSAFRKQTSGSCHCGIFNKDLN